MTDRQQGSGSGSVRSADPGRTNHRGRDRWLQIGGAVLLALIGTATVLGLSARSAYADLTASRDDLFAARQALADKDLAAARTSLASAAGHAAVASDEVDSPLWDAAAAIPWAGVTPAAVQSVAVALDQALAVLGPTGEQLTALDPDSLIAPDGRIDLVALGKSVPPMKSARAGIEQAKATLAEAPSRAAGDQVLSAVDDAATELADQLAQLDETLGTAVTAATIVPPLLGADEPKRYLMAILNPNEARGTGGFFGQYAIIRADSGKITVEQVGSNSELPSLPATPPELGEQWIARYEDGPRLMPNFNISPHHPDAALLWLESWRLKTGETLDGAFSADVVALGELVTATGQRVPLPDGGSLTGAELTQFAIQGIYEKFPQPGESATRKAYQEAVTAAAFDVVVNSQSRSTLASVLGSALSDRRVQLWSSDEALQQEILDAGLGGSLAVPQGHHVAFAAINSSGSKLDAFLERSLAYAVGRCPNPESGRVISTVDISLTSAIPMDVTVPEYMISLAKRGPDGPINSTLAQVYLPMGASESEVFVDGKSSQYQTFREQDRLAVLLPLKLPPGKERTLTVEFSEPADDGPGSAPQQPLGSDQVTTITERDCQAAHGDDGETDPPMDPANDPLGPLVPLREDEPADLS